MKTLIIDSGTTHTRATIVVNEEIKGEGSVEVGARDTAMTGKKEELKIGLREAIEVALEKAGIEEEELELAVGLGMITSNLGLIDIPHLTVPVDVKDLASNIRVQEFPSILSIPIHFIPGVKNPNHNLTLDTLYRADFMRGEETQVIGIMELFRIQIPVNIVILSSHTKIIGVDERGRIIGSLTTMSGQLFQAIIKETFLANSIQPRNFPEKKLDLKNLTKGYELTKKWGLLRTLLMPRFMHILMETTPIERISFLEGALAGSDIKALENADVLGIHPKEGLIFVGNSLRCQAYRYLAIHQKLCEEERIKILKDPRKIRKTTIIGALKIAKTAPKSALKDSNTYLRR